MKVGRSVFVVLIAVLLLSGWSQGGGTEKEEPREIGSRRELFVDRFLIDRLEGVELKLHEPVSAGVAIKIDRPWESKFNYGYKLFKEGGLYHLYYLARKIIGGEKRFIRSISYARSQDGIH